MSGGVLCCDWVEYVRLGARIPANGFGRLFAVNAGIGYLVFIPKFQIREFGLQLLPETENRVHSAYILPMWVALIYKVIY